MQSLTAELPRPPELNFKFKYLNENGDAQGWSDHEGVLREGVLGLEGRRIPLSALRQFTARDRARVSFVTLIDNTPQTFILRILGGKLAQLSQTLIALQVRDRVQKRQELRQQLGIKTPLEIKVCPTCHAIIDLTGFQSTSHVWCEHCDTLHENKPVALEPLTDFRRCPTCQLFGWLRWFKYNQHSDFYTHREVSTFEKFCCPGCIGREAKRIMGSGLASWRDFGEGFILWLKSRRGLGPYPKLHQANVLVIRRRFDQAMKIYNHILHEHPDAVGVKFNLARTMFRKNDYKQAMKEMEHVLELCSNFYPAAEILADLYAKFRLADHRKALAAPWEGEEAEILAQQQAQTDDPQPPAPSSESES